MNIYHINFNKEFLEYFILIYIIIVLALYCYRMILEENIIPKHKYLRLAPYEVTKQLKQLKFIYVFCPIFNVFYFIFKLIQFIYIAKKEYEAYHNKLFLCNSCEIFYRRYELVKNCCPHCNHHYMQHSTFVMNPKLLSITLKHTPILSFSELKERKKEEIKQNKKQLKEQHVETIEKKKKEDMQYFIDVNLDQLKKLNNLNNKE